MRRARASHAFLTGRDLDLLLALFRFRMMSLRHVEQLFFPSVQTAARRVRLLAARGYVEVFRVPGVEDRLVVLDRGGLTVVAGELGVEAKSLGPVRKRLPKDYLFTKHSLALTDVRLALEAACGSRTDLSLLGFLADHVSRRTPGGGVEKYLRQVASGAARLDSSVAHIPDGVFAIARGGKAALFFLEVDRGSEPIGNPERGVGKFLRFYAALLEGGEYQRFGQDFGVREPFRGFRVLIVTSSERRLANMRMKHSARTGEAPRASRFIWLAAAEAVRAETVLDRIWVSLDAADTSRYGIAPGENSLASPPRGRDAGDGAAP